MFRKILILLTVLCLAAAACAEEAPETLMEKAVRLAEDGEDLIRQSEDDVYDGLGIEPEDYTDWAYLSGRESLLGRELLVFRAVDEEAAERIAELLEGYRQYHMEMTRNYPDQAEKYRALSEAEVKRKGLMVVLSVDAPDPAEAELLLQEE
ncbi:MAG: DUF4358 domain-containing protein [Clostridia bacterium]|nr:DUF4358 domain-containing protein [Clostridia bacterium]